LGGTDDETNLITLCIVCYGKVHGSGIDNNHITLIKAGMKRAKARGIVFGRKPVLDAGERRKIAERYSAGETMAQLAREYSCGVATIHRAIHGR
jgi:hypothetical protein